MGKLLDFSRPHLLRDEREYKAAVTEIDRLLDLDSAAGTEEYERLEFLSVLVEEYERDEFPVGGDISVQEIVDFVLEQRGWNRSALARIMGGRSRVSEFFSAKRSLSKSQIEALHRELGIPADLLLSSEAA